VTKILKNLAFTLMSWRRRRRWLKFLKIIYGSGGGAAGSLDYQRRRLKNLGNFSSVGGGGG
jgi:hypothetical protein